MISGFASKADRFGSSGEPPTTQRRQTKKKGTPKRPFPVFRKFRVYQNAKTTVPLIVRGAPIWTKPGLP